MFGNLVPLRKKKHLLNLVWCGSSCSPQTPADSHVWSVRGQLEGPNMPQSERASRDTGGGGSGTVSQPICSSSLILKRKRSGKGKGRRGEERRGGSDTTPAILFLSSAATAFVAMTMQADDLIAVTFECCPLKVPVTQDRSRQTRRRRTSCIAADNPQHVRN